MQLVSAQEAARGATALQAPNGIHYASFGLTQMPALDLERMVQAIPNSIAAALNRNIYCFVPLVMSESEEPYIAPEYSREWSDQAICHRNAVCNGGDYTFISTRLMHDRFALAFEYFINAGHHFVDAVGVPDTFSKLVWAQVEADVRGETSQDAWESRRQAWGGPGHPLDEKARTAYLEAAFSDAVAIYLLSLTVDFDYSELRERGYPLLAPQALGERLRAMAALFPPNAGYEFSIRSQRRMG